MQPVKNLKALYDSNAEQAARQCYADTSALPAFQSLMKLLPPKPRILDLGCGTGHESLRLKGLGAEVVGLDFSERSLDIARRFAPDIPFHAGDMLCDYAHLGHFDAVVAIACFVHLQEHQLEQAFSQIAKVLRPDGKLLMLVLHGEGKQTQYGNAVVDGVAYDREMYGQTPELLSIHCEGLLQYAGPICPGTREPWRWHLFTKA